jgi:hypothetical protein
MTMSDDRIGKLLERVALEIHELVLDSAAGNETVLEERLGPLLRAGQEMYEKEELESRLTDSGLSEALGARQAYAAALNELTGLAALEGRDGK